MLEILEAPTVYASICCLRNPTMPLESGPRTKIQRHVTSDKSRMVAAQRRAVQYRFMMGGMDLGITASSARLPRFWQYLFSVASADYLSGARPQGFSQVLR